MSVALFLSIFIIGVWHGAKWGYAIFGIMHATAMIISSHTLAKRDAFWKRVGMPPALLYSTRLVVTFSFVLMTYIFFRADTIHDAIVMYRGIFSLGLLHDIGQAFTGTAAADLLYPATPWLYIVIVIAGDILARKKLLLKFPPAVQYVAYAVAVIMITAAWMDHYVAQTFVYNKF